MTVTYFHATPFTYNGDMLSKQFESEEKLLNDALQENVLETRLDLLCSLTHLEEFAIFSRSQAFSE